MNDAYGRAIAVYGPPDEWTLTDSDVTSQTTRVGERITEFMKVSKNCGVSTNQGCFKNSNVAKIAGGATSINIESGTGRNIFYKIISADGTSIGFNKEQHWITVDIDGPQKGNNKLGVDIFCFDLRKDSIDPKRYSFNEYLTDLQSVGQNASGWIIDYDNMDYLKLNSQGKCPNGAAPTEQNPRCK